MNTETPRYRIWAQGGTDRVGHAPYLARLLPFQQSMLDPDFSLDFQTFTPSVTTTHALSEYRFGRAAIKGAIEAERQGYDAYYMNHFQDAGLIEARASVSIPVLGLGEATLLFACTLGRRLGLIAINPAFVPWHIDQVGCYGLRDRVAGVRTIDARIPDYMAAFDDAAMRARLTDLFVREARALIAAGADVLVPTGGIPMMLFGADPGAAVDGAPVVNGCAVVVKATEMAVKLRRLTGVGPSRLPASGFGLPDDQTLREFLENG
ncbi:MAG: aspartate/glutamate racemase family protein [Lautropia sp.]